MMRTDSHEKCTKTENAVEKIDGALATPISISPIDSDTCKTILNIFNFALV